MRIGLSFVLTPTVRPVWAALGRLTEAHPKGEEVKCRLKRKDNSRPYK